MPLASTLYPSAQRAQFAQHAPYPQRAQPFTPRVAPRPAVPKSSPAPQSAFVQHNVGMVGFHTQSFVIARPTDPRATWLAERAAQLPTRFHPSMGQTNITAAIRLALELLSTRPVGSINGITLLSDGQANVEHDQIWAAVGEATQAGISIDVVAFGDDADEATLRRIAESSLGRYMKVGALKAMTQAFRGNAERLDQRARGGLTCNVLAIDLSHSMNEPAGSGQPKKILVVRDAVADLLKWYAARFPGQLVA